MTARIRCAGWTLFFAAQGVLLASAYVVFTWRNHYIKAYSDPATWVALALEGGPALQDAALSPAYPLFLRMVIRVAGVHLAFLSNMPILMLVAVLAGVLTALAVSRTSSGVRAACAGLMGCALLLSLDPHVMIYLTNPYRDALAAVFLLLCIILVVRFGREVTVAGWPLALAGWFLGTGYCVRETVALFLPAILLYLACRRVRGGRIAVLKTGCLFGCGLLLGIMPALVHSWVSTDQLLVPAYSAGEGRLLPGLHWAAWTSTFPRAWTYYSELLGWRFAGPALLGIGFALWRRNLEILALIVPCALINFLFFSFYWTFSVRYFFVFSVFLAPLIVYGGYETVLRLMRPVRRPRATSGLLAGATLVVSLCAAGRLLCIVPPAPEFQVTEARKLTEDVEAVVENGAYILTPRHLCEVLHTLTHASSVSLSSSLIHFDGDVGRALSYVHGILGSGTLVYVIRIPDASGEDQESDAVRQAFDLQFVRRFDPVDYHLDRIVDGGALELFRLTRRAIDDEAGK